MRARLEIRVTWGGGRGRKELQVQNNENAKVISREKYQ